MDTGLFLSDRWQNQTIAFTFIVAGICSIRPISNAAYISAIITDTTVKLMYCHEQ